MVILISAYPSHSRILSPCSRKTASFGSSPAVPDLRWEPTLPLQGYVSNRDAHPQVLKASERKDSLLFAARSGPSLCIYNERLKHTMPTINEWPTAEPPVDKSPLHKWMLRRAFPCFLKSIVSWWLDSRINTAIILKTVEETDTDDDMVLNAGFIKKLYIHMIKRFQAGKRWKKLKFEFYFAHGNVYFLW